MEGEMEGEKSEGRKILVWNLFPPAVYKCSHKTREILKTSGLIMMSLYMALI